MAQFVIVEEGLGRFFEAFELHCEGGSEVANSARRDRLPGDIALRHIGIIA